MLLYVIDEDTTSHLFSYLFLKLQVPEVMNSDKIKFEDAYNGDLDKMLCIVQLFEKL